MFLPLLPKAEGLNFRGDYFIYSDDINYLFGSGNITIQTDQGKMEIKGDVLYLRIGGITGVIYGNVVVNRYSPSGNKQKKIVRVEQYDAVFFKGIPTNWLMISFKEKIEMSGAIEMIPFYQHFIKKTPEELKDSSLFFEFKEFRINKNRRIKAKNVIPYMMGLPTFPLRKFTVRRGAWTEKTQLAFQNVNYSEIDGLSAAFYFRLREPFVFGDHNIKLYERKTFGLKNEPYRGVLITGDTHFKTNKKNVFDISTLWNSGEGSYRFRLIHQWNSKSIQYNISQTFSGKRDQSYFSEISSEIKYNKIKWMIPGFKFNYDWKKSFNYQFSTALSLVKNLKLNLKWHRRLIKNTYRTDSSDFSTTMNFTGTLFDLTADANYSKNLLESSVKKNYSVNMRLKSIWLLMDNITLDISSFVMGSSVPSGTGLRSTFSPGIHMAVNSGGARMPLGFQLVPGFSFNHLWDNQEENFTDFSYHLSLQKEMGVFKSSIDYSLASRYRARNFWVEGNNRQNLNLNFELKKSEYYSFLLRFSYNNNLVLENVSLTGQLDLLNDLRFSSFLLFYAEENKFQTMEIFIEKTFKKRLKVQGGYSLALKRFFIKVLML